MVIDKKNDVSVGTVFLPPPTEESISKKVESGLDFILSHFEEPYFPRKVSTAATNEKQYEVNDKDRTMLFYQTALWEDCRIAAFGIKQENPNLIFIDLDAQDFASMRSFKLALTKTLKNIKKKIGGTPSLLWSGRGYHIIQPIDCPIPLEQIQELAALEPHTSNKFLQFCESYLTAGRRDKGHHPAIKSCQLKIPYTLNSKCKAAGIDPEVKIIQKWNGHRPSYKLLLGSFYADLIAKNQQLYREYQRQKKKQVIILQHPRSDQQDSYSCHPIAWIEKLFQTYIDDYRKRARDLILVPYLVVRRGITDEEQIENIVMEWADSCAELRRLEPSRYEFVAKVRSRIYSCM
nr:hypothetical protein [Thermoproteota archaeon]